jgi:hypothetical protein
VDTVFVLISYFQVTEVHAKCPGVLPTTYVVHRGTLTWFHVTVGLCCLSSAGQ